MLCLKTGGGFGGAEAFGGRLRYELVRPWHALS